MRKLVLLLLTAAMAAACGSTTSPSGVDTLQKIDLTVGNGLEATTGRTVTVHYIGWLYDKNAADNKGAYFDSVVAPNSFPFVVGANTIIAGWNQGIPGMRVGGIRRLIIPPDLGYGSQGMGSIPPNATLVFEIELLAVE
jgi:FKBP-type peptidyl-prolyl cis-trans isomerase FkpA